MTEKATATPTDTETLLLVDGSSYLYRAYHALPDLRGPGGVPTGAIHGVVAMMKKLREDIPCSHAACVFDAKGKTFRDDWYADYKANRSAMPDDLTRQIEPIHEAVKLLGWPVLEIPGIEADDAIGTLACMAAKAGHKVVISTGDKDLAQLVTPRVTLINTMSKPPEVLDVEGVITKFGVPPERIVDYLTLIGDSVDNVPGVEKVGPKTAAKWIAEHGSLDGVIANAAGVKGAVGDNLRRALEWLPQGRRLVTVVTDCDLSGHVMDWPEFQSLALRDVDREGLLAFYERYGFKALKRELENEMRADAAIASAGLSAGEPVPPAPPLERRYDTIVTVEALDAWIAKAQAAPITAVDTETDSLDPMAARIIGISFAVAPGEAAYIPLAHTYAGAPDQLPFDTVRARLKPWLENESAAKVGQNIKYDTQVFAGAGIEARGYLHDTMLQSYVLEAHKPHGLDSLALRHLGRQGLSYEDVCGKGVNQIPFTQVEVGRATEYSGEDSELTLLVHQALWPKFESEPDLRHVYRDIEMAVS
ncbi:MAG TPA: 5'-3' exonuclease H3TH domain-containing protein, partial [Albitalea sp.]|nr:5'-3' exonuclease H3TH domain-containing protein [Albitalea sp.]